MLKKLGTQAVSIFLSLSMVFCTGTASGGLSPAAPQIPGFVRALRPPVHLGFLDSWYQGQSKAPVVLIQDLHANYGVQKKIYGLLKYLQPKVAPSGRPMVVGIEAAWGDLDLGFIRKESKELREAVGEFFLKEAEITGMEHFTAMSEEPVRLVGIDNPADYILHRDLFRKSLIARMNLAYKVDKLRFLIAQSKGKAPQAIKRIWKIEENFRSGNLSFEDLGAKLNASAPKDYGAAEALFYQKKMELAGQEKGDRSLFIKNLVKADQDLELLSRLFRQQLTLEEVQFVAQKISEMLVVVTALLPGEKLDEWKETIREAIDYYAVALMRDKPLSEHARELAEKNADVSVVIVTGGFHTAGIARTLRERKMSYVVIAPIVESHTRHDELLYLQRLMGKHVSEQEIAHAAHSLLTVATLGVTGVESQVAQTANADATVTGRASTVYDTAGEAAPVFARTVEAFRTALPLHKRVGQAIVRPFSRLLHGAKEKLQTMVDKMSLGRAKPFHLLPLPVAEDKEGKTLKKGWKTSRAFPDNPDAMGYVRILQHLSNFGVYRASGAQVLALHDELITLGGRIVDKNSKTLIIEPFEPTINIIPKKNYFIFRDLKTERVVLKYAEMENQVSPIKRIEMGIHYPFPLEKSITESLAVKGKSLEAMKEQYGRIFVELGPKSFVAETVFEKDGVTVGFDYDTLYKHQARIESAIDQETTWLIEGPSGEGRHEEREALVTEKTVLNIWKKVSNEGFQMAMADLDRGTPWDFAEDLARRILTRINKQYSGFENLVPAVQLRELQTSRLVYQEVLSWIKEIEDRFPGSTKGLYLSAHLPVPSPEAIERSKAVLEQTTLPSEPKGFFAKVLGMPSWLVGKLTTNDQKSRIEEAGRNLTAWAA